jgi:hypothetical protein
MEKSARHAGNRFLDALVEDLEPVRPGWTWSSATGAWFLFAGLLVSLGILATGPIRESAGADLYSIRFALELLLGASATVALIAAALEMGVPGAPNRLELLGLGVVLAAGWLGLAVFGHDLFGDAVNGPAYSMIGKREHCLIQGTGISLATTVPGIALVRHRAFNQHWAGGFLIGAASASLTALWMQVACMYEPAHALELHFSPILLTGSAGAALAHHFRPLP